MSKLNMISATCLCSLLLGCVATDPSETSSQAPAKNVYIASLHDLNKMPSFTYSANGKHYLVRYKRDRVFNMIVAVLSVQSGKPFTGDAVEGVEAQNIITVEDAEAQNTIRDAFRSNKMCKDGKHPGILQFGYGPLLVSDGSWIWNSKVRCSKTHQANI